MVEKNENALAIVNVNEGNVGKSWCSIVPTGERKNDAKIFAALNNPEFKIGDFINKQIAVKDVLVEIRELVNEETGVIDIVPRTVLIDAGGKAYQATSKGIFNAIKNAFEVFGSAPWNPPLVIEVKQRNVKAGSMLTFDVVG